MTRWVLNQHYRIKQRVGILSRQHSKNLLKQQTTDSEQTATVSTTVDGGNNGNSGGGRPRTRETRDRDTSVSGIIGRLRGASGASMKKQLDLRAILRTQEGFESFAHVSVLFLFLFFIFLVC